MFLLRISIRAKKQSGLTNRNPIRLYLPYTILQLPNEFYRPQPVTLPPLPRGILHCLDIRPLFYRSILNRNPTDLSFKLCRSSSELYATSFENYILELFWDDFECFV